MLFSRQRHDTVQALRPSIVRKTLRAVKQSIRARFGRCPPSHNHAIPPVDASKNIGGSNPEVCLSSTTPQPTSPPSPLRSSASVHASQGAPHTNRVSVGCQAPSTPPSPTHTRSSPSSGPDSPFECITPSADGGAGLLNLQTPQVVDPHRLSPLAAHLAHGLPSTPRDIDERLRTLDATASEWSKYAQKAAQCADRVHSLLLDIESTGTPAVSPLPGVVEAQDAASDPHPKVGEAASADPESETALGPTPQVEDVNPADGTDDHPTITNPNTGHEYKVHGVVGEGSFGRVLKLTDEHDRCFAAKAVHKQLAYQTAGARDMLVRELYAMRHVQSDTPNNCRLVRLLESWEDADNVYFIMVRPVRSMRRTLSYLFACPLAAI